MKQKKKTDKYSDYIAENLEINKKYKKYTADKLTKINHPLGINKYY